jgi:ADP-ribose pyrophosphatase YjhB (NUDIX family)
MSHVDVRDETSAGGVVFRLDGGHALYLLIRDSYQNWGFPKGHLEAGEIPETAALREVGEETGLADLSIRGDIKFLMETRESSTLPQRAEGITACRWSAYDDAVTLVSYPNARDVLRRAQEMVLESSALS